VDRRNLVATVAGFAVAAIALGALAAVVGAREVLAAIGRAEPLYVGAVAVAVLAWLCLWGLGLWVVLAAGGTQVSAVDAILVNAGAAFANHVTPFGQAGGEPVAAWLVSDVADVSFERSLAAVTSFDTINVVPSLSLAGVGLAAYAAVGTLDARLRLLLGGVLVAAAAFVLALALAWRYGDAIEGGLVRVLDPVARAVGRTVPFLDRPPGAAIESRVEGFVAGIGRVARDRRRLALALCLSTAGWAVQAVGLWAALLALGSPVPVYVPLFVVPLGTVANAVPTPGGLGGIEAVQVTLLVGTTGVAAATATAAVAIFSVGGFALTTSVGAAAVTVLKVRDWGPAGTHR